MISLLCDLKERGWFEIKLSNGINAVEIDASYLSDAVGDLISSVRTILNGYKFSSCRFQDEPGEYRFLLEKDDEMINIKVLKFNQSFSKESNDKGKLIFEGTDNIHNFAKGIKRQYDRLLFNYGIEGYKNIWNYEFPFKELEKLNEVIAVYNRK